MIAIKRNCLDPNELRLVLEGELSNEAFDSAISHLDQCETCRTAAETLDGDVNRILGQAAVTDDREASERLQSETACQVALQNLLQTPTPVPTSSAATAPPFELLGPYRLVELIGSGGMGAVYLGEHQRLRRQCAIKLLPPEKVTQTGWLERFDREMTTIASLEHPNIVRATDAGHESGWHFLVMEHLDGLDLGRIASRMGQLDVADACEIVRQAALGLAHIHDSGLVHRDIKPSNLMLTRSGTVKLLDLGLVLDGDDPLSHDDRLTTVGHVMGTMPYMAPEQLADSRDVHPQSDIYSLGATLFRLIAGRPPHRSSRGLASQVLAITNQDATPLDSIREDVDREVVSLVAKMLSRDLKKRPTSAKAIAEQLEPFAKPSRLKRLVRDAVRKRDADDLPPSGLMPSIAKPQNDGGRSKLRSFLLACCAAFLVAAAAMVIKIQTDVGDLIIHSEQTGLTVVVKQGDEVVERLQIESTGDNRKTLRKGTYQVEIQGGGEALALSDEVVTIGRGTEQSVSVVQQTLQPASLGPDVIAGTDAKSESDDAEQETPAEKASSNKGMPDLMDWATHNGYPLSHWIEQIQTEQDVNKIGDATFNAFAALQSVHSVGMSNVNETRKVIDALIQRAREFGGLDSKLPPIAGVTEANESTSAHFTWFLAEVFADPNFTLWLEAAAQELIDGNTNSRAAMVYCLHRRFTPRQAANGMGGGMMGGGMGGMGGYGYTVPAGIDPQNSKILLSRLIRCCVGLGSAQAWAELSPDDRDRAARMAREVAIVIGQYSGLRFSQAVNQELINLLRDTPLKDRSEIEQQIYIEEDFQGTKDSGDTSDAGNSDPSPDSATGTMPAADTLPATAPAASGDSPVQIPLFQGKDLLTWLNALQSERDVASLGLAMKAVELLTRDKERWVRVDAAQKTMKRARQLGGMILGGESDPNPSHAFMSHFLSAFANYLPDPGLEVIFEELQNGTAKSKMAAVWSMQNFLSGVKDETVSVENLRAVEQWMAGVGNDPSQMKTLAQYRNLLLETADWFRAQSDIGTEKGIAANTTLQCAIDLTLLLGEPVQDSPALVTSIIADIDRAIAAQSTTGGGFSGFGQGYTVGDPVLFAAIQLAEDDPEFGTEQRWQYFASRIVAPRYGGITERFQTAFNSVKKVAKKPLLDSIKLTLQNPGFHVQSNSLLELMIPLFASEYEPVKEASEALNTFRNSCDLSQPYQQNLKDVVDQAEQTIQDRLGE